MIKHLHVFNIILWFWVMVLQGIAYMTSGSIFHIVIFVLALLIITFEIFWLGEEE